MTITNLISNIKIGASYLKLDIRDIMKVADSFIRYAALGEPDIVVGIIPLYNCTFFDVSLSQDILKFRAVEAQFLAHQPATAYAMRIDFRIPTRLSIFMQLIQAMYYFSAPVAALFIPQIVAIGPGFTGFPEHITYGKTLSEFETEALLNPGTRRARVVMSQYWKEDTVRLTFPVILKNIVFFDMYIESFFWSRDVEDGDILKGTILLRKYIPPPKTMLYISEVKRKGIGTGKYRYGSRLVSSIPNKLEWAEFEAPKAGPASTKLLQEKSISISAAGGHTSYTLPKVIKKNTIIGSVGESDYYEDMMRYTRKDAIKQFVYYILSESKRVFVEKTRSYNIPDEWRANTNKYYDPAEGRVFKHPTDGTQMDYSEEILSAGTSIDIGFGAKLSALDRGNLRMKIFVEKHGLPYEIDPDIKTFTVKTDRRYYFYIKMISDYSAEVKHWWVLE